MSKKRNDADNRNSTRVRLRSERKKGSSSKDSWTVGRPRSTDVEGYCASVQDPDEWCDILGDEKHSEGREGQKGTKRLCFYV